MAKKPPNTVPESLYFSTVSTVCTIPGEIQYHSSGWEFFDNLGSFNPRTYVHAHTASHNAGASDPIIVQNLSSGAASEDLVLRTNGSGGWNLVPYEGLPAATETGQILYSHNGSTFVPAKPVVTDDGFIVVDDNGNIVVEIE